MIHQCLETYIGKTMSSREFLIHLVLVLVCAFAAVALQLRSYVPPMQMLGLPKTDAGLQIIDLPSIEITGIRGSINWSDNYKAVADVNQLWEQFDSSIALHETLDWSNHQVVFAYYDLSSVDLSRIPVVIGYDSTEMKRKSEFQSVLTIPGRYQHYAIEHPDTSLVTSVWQEFSSLPSSPSAVIERYQIDELGQLQAIEMQVKIP